MSPNDTARDEARADLLADLRQTIDQMRADNLTRDAAKAAVWEMMAEHVEAYISEEMGHSPPEQVGSFRDRIEKMMRGVLDDAFAHI